jgi:6-phosphogluconolactonase (cycloisomerase 2 family)
MLLLMSLPGCGGSLFTSTSSHLAFVSLTASNMIAAYRIDNSSGGFTSVAGSPYLGGDSPTSLLMHPSGKYVYAANQIGNDISLFDVDSSVGSLSEVLPRTPAGVSPVSMVMNATGSLLFVSNVFSSSISVYSISSQTGALSQIQGSPFSTYSQPGPLAITPSGDFLYTLNGNDSSIVGFAVGSSGSLHPLAPLPLTDPPFAVAVDPAGKYLYVTNATVNALSIFSINASTGALSIVSGTPIATGDAPVAVAVHPNGQYVYVANELSNNVSIYSIAPATGVPTQVSDSPFSVLTEPLFLQWDPNGDWLYVGSLTEKVISEYSFSANGDLSVQNESTTLGTVPTSMVVGH